MEDEQDGCNWVVGAAIVEARLLITAANMEIFGATNPGETLIPLVQFYWGISLVSCHALYFSFSPH